MAKRELSNCAAYALSALFILALLTLPSIPWVIKSHFEARAFNNATGKNVSTWDAMWIELRVESEAGK